MTEAEWLRCSDPEMMLDFLRPRASERKLRLFACACCREAEVWHFLASRHSRNAVEKAEQFADGKANPEELATAIAVVSKGRGGGVYWNKVRLSSGAQADRAVLAAAKESAWKAAWETSRIVVNLVNWHRQCDLLRDIFGDVVYPVSTDFIPVPPEVVGLAQMIYEERAFHRMSNIADALEKASSTNSGILAHSRGPGPHARGCWAVDLLLGKS